MNIYKITQLTASVILTVAFAVTAHAETQAIKIKELDKASPLLMKDHGGRSTGKRAHGKYLDRSSPILMAYTGNDVQAKIRDVSRIDVRTPAGRKAQAMVQRGKQLNQQLFSAQLTDQQFDNIQQQIKMLTTEMDAMGKPAEGSQGACFGSCDDQYGSGFGKGKGWNRFWCKASCFKVNINVGTGGDSSPTTGNTNDLVLRKKP